MPAPSLKNMAPTTISFGLPEKDRFDIALEGPTYSNSSDSDDSQWISARIIVQAGSFSGKFGCCLRQDDFTSFLPSALSLYETLQGKAEFQTMEDQICFVLSGNGRGNIEVKATAMDQAGIGNSLSFSLVIDQTILGKALEDIRTWQKGLLKSRPSL